jgi:tetratricopeptide (TPR) repeat protein
MKQVFCAITVLAALGLSACATEAESGSRERTFVRALERFDSAKTPEEYRQAAALFESLLEGGYQNGAVYYNLGNAYMRSGDFGKAIAAYRKAKPFRPRDPYLDANLRQALMLAPGKLPEAPAPWWKPVFFWSGWMSYPEKFAAVLAGFGLGAALAALGLLLHRKRLYWVSGVAVMIAAVLSVDAALAYSDVNQSRRAVVVHETVARKGVGKQWEPAFDQALKDGAEFTILERSGDWVLGHFEGIGDGWLPREAIAE